MIMISKQSSSSIIVIALALVSAAKSSIAKHGQITKMSRGGTQSTVRWQSMPVLITSTGSIPLKSLSKYRGLDKVKSTKSRKASSSKSVSKSTTFKSCKSTSGSSKSSKSEKTSSKGSKSADGKSASGTKKSSKPATTLPCSESPSPSNSPTLSRSQKDVRTQTPSTSPSVSQSKESPTESPSQGATAAPSKQDIENEVSMAPSIQTSAGEEDWSNSPAAAPSHAHSATPSMGPSGSPNEASSTSAPVSQVPSSGPSAVPSYVASLAPSVSPSPEEEFPTATPSNAKNASPSTLPNISPSQAPSTDNGELETALPLQEPSSSPSVSMAPSRVRPTSVEEDGHTQVLLSDPPSASPSLTDSPSQESTSASMLDAIEVCYCNEDNVCIGAKLTKVMELLRLCFFASDEQTIESVNNLKLDQPSLYSADILVDDAEISDQVERTCDDGRQTCVVLTPVDAAFFVLDVPPPLMAQGTVVSTVRHESRSLRGSRRVEQVVMAFNVVVELEKTTIGRSFEEMGIPINSDAKRVRKPWWVIGICFFCLNIGVVALVTYWDTIKMKHRERQLGPSEGPTALGTVN